MTTRPKPATRIGSCECVSSRRVVGWVVTSGNGWDGIPTVRPCPRHLPATFAAWQAGAFLPPWVTAA